MDRDILWMVIIFFTAGFMLGGSMFAWGIHLGIVLKNWHQDKDIDKQNQPCAYRDRGIVCQRLGTHKVASWHPEHGEISAFLCDYHYGTMTGEVAQQL